MRELGYHTAKNQRDTVEIFVKKGVMERRAGEKRHKIV